MTNPPVDVQQYGQSIWLDFIHRNSLDNGEMQKYIDEFGVIGVTSNPAIFQKAIGESDTYDTAITGLLELDAYNIYEKLAVEDIQRALDLFRPIYDRTNKRDGYVSLEVSPLIANDSETTTSEALRLFKLVNRPNLMIKIPATPAGLPAIEEAISQGVNVNVTLIFAVDNYEDVARAYIRGLERRLAAGGDVSHIASVASFFLSRIDVMIDRTLENNIRAAQGRDLEVVAKNRELLGKAAIANAKLAYKRFMEMFYGDEFAKLRAAGAQVQRPLWASTGTKNPAYPDTIYVDTLIGKDTVNTVPPATLKAFKDHGTAADTLATNLDQVEATLGQLGEVGVDLNHVTTQLQADGVTLFVEAFENLLKQVEAKRDILEAGVIEKKNLALGIHGDAVQAAVNKMAADKVNARIWAHDGSVWKDQPNLITKIEQRLGWLDTDKTIDLARLKSLQASVKAGGFSHVLLLGMGGSSLAPEVLYDTFGQQAGFPAFHMLDSTDPEYIRFIETTIDVHKTLFIVASKSGGTIETAIFAKYFFEKAGKNGKQFIAITDAGSDLEKDATAHGYWDVFLNPADIGGRFSALSYFGMVPAAVMGLDLDKLSEEATRMMKACSKIIPEYQHPGIWLGSIMGVVGQQGRDKITILTSHSISSLGNWIEQLIAESTGKEGKGVLPVVGATVGNPHDYSSDRLIVYLKVEDDPDNETVDSGIRALREAGHPRVTFYLPNKYAVAGEFFRWEYATAVAGKVLDINPFDEPNVTESKENTARLLKSYIDHSGLPTSEHAFKERDVELFADEKMLRLLSELCLQHNYGSGDLTGLVAALINSTMAGDYFAILAYLPMKPEIVATLEEIRRRLRHTTRRAVTLGFGPRYLHSTGQYHKGGPNNGNFIQITYDDPQDIDIPGDVYTFGVVKAAQAAGDLEALRAKDRRVVRLHISGEIEQGLDVLMKAIDLVDERRR
ncbi:MAG: bifunctional transaldolase/phosoglucose isomerase [Chloroflexi bacterium]|nr:bifunctional transaldolase/phosoglucose isomerase [Chloroflexota bacterium]MCC6897185.1 bifunctional transaldolase/phosoglucose isomerase [Anaerolineae bacterium]